LSPKPTDPTIKCRTISGVSNNAADGEAKESLERGAEDTVGIVQNKRRIWAKTSVIRESEQEEKTSASCASKALAS